MDINAFIGQFITLVKRLLLILFIFTFTRILFLVVNWSYFQPLNFTETFDSFLYGIRFDFIAVFYVNSIFIFYHFLPFRFINSQRSYKFIKICMVVVNSILILFNLVDIAYFKYLGKRSGWELIQMLYTSTDTASILPQYLIRFWYLLIILIICIFILIRFFARFKPILYVKTHNRNSFKFFQILFSIVFLFSCYIFARGIEVKPIRIITANRYVSPKYIPLLLNTPFTILNTIRQEKETINNFYTTSELEKIYCPIHKHNQTDHFKKMNVVIIILESFGKEYFNSKSEEGERFTPFLDSLSRVGLYCTNAFANAKRSIDAMPPILGGFPSLLQTSFLSSVYSVNKVQGLASLLKNENYETAFFHGGKNGTMGFDMFCKSVGIDQYYGKTEYGNDNDFDGGWGIWDEEFLQYMDNTINSFRQPFLSVVFTLSSHEPYHLPEKYRNQFFPGEPKILRTVAYTDFALKRFFETAKKMSWFNNTLFVITPDHTSVAFDRKYKSAVGRVSIPIIYYCPSDTSLHGDYSNVTQQLDILPSVLDYLNYPKRYVSFGKSIFSEGYRYSVCFNDINFQLIDSAYCLTFDGAKTVRMNNYRTDPFLTYNLTKTKEKDRLELEKNIKAYLQDYFLRLNHNLLSDTNILMNDQQLNPKE